MKKLLCLVFALTLVFTACSGSGDSGKTSAKSASDIVTELVPADLLTDFKSDDIKAVLVGSAGASVEVLYNDGTLTAYSFTENYSGVESIGYKIQDIDGKTVLTYVYTSTELNYWLVQENTIITDPALADDDFSYMTATRKCDIVPAGYGKTDLTDTWYILGYADKSGSYRFTSADKVNFENSETGEKSELNYKIEGAKLTITADDGTVYVEGFYDDSGHLHYSYKTVAYGTIG